MLRPPTTLGTDGPLSGGGGTLASLLTTAITAETAGSQIAAALDSDQQEELTAQLRGEGIALPWEVLWDVDWRTQAAEDLAALGDGTIARWGGSVVLADTSAGTAVVSSSGLTLGRSGASGVGASVSPDLGVLDPDLPGLRIVAQIAASPAYSVDGDQGQVWLQSHAGNLANPGRGIGCSQRRFTASSYGCRSARYLDGTWTSNVDRSDYGAQSRAHLEIRRTLRGWRTYYRSGLADGLPSVADMDSGLVGSFGFLLGSETADQVLVLRYLRLVPNAVGTTATSTTYERLWALSMGV